MAIEPFRARVRPQVTLTGGVSEAAQGGTLRAIASAAQAGAGVLEQQQQQQDQLDVLRRRVAEKEKQDRDTALHVAQAEAYAQMTQRMKTRAVELATAPDAPQQLEREWGTERDAFLARFGENEDVRQRFVPNLASFGGELIGDAQRAQIAANARAIGAAAESAVDMTINRRTAGFADLAQGFADLDLIFDGPTGLPAPLVDVKRKEARGRLLLAKARHALANGEHEGVATLIDAKDSPFAAYLDPNELGNLRAQVGAARNAEAAAARSAQAAQRQELNDQISAINTLIDAGGDPGDDVLNGLAAQSAALGDQSQAMKLKVWQQQVAVNRRFKGVPSTQLKAAERELTALDNAGQLGVDGQVALKQLRTLVDRKEDDEAAPIREMYKQGTAGRLQALAELERLPPAQRKTMGDRAGDHFGSYALLPRPWQAEAVAGLEARKLLKDQLTDKPVMAAMRRKMGSTMTAIPAGAIASIRDVAESLYAYEAQRLGRDKFDPDLMDVAIHKALGGTRVNGEWRGGIGMFNGKQVILPERFSAAQFTSTILNDPFGDARDASGAPVTKAYVSGRLHPVYLRDNGDGTEALYVWEDEAGNRLRHRRGGDYVSRVKR